MRARGILLTVIVVLGIVFAILNWEALVTTLPLNLLFMRVSWPLGITLLVAVLAVALIFFLVSLLDRAGQLRHVTGMQRQLESTRARLDAQRDDDDALLTRRLDTGFADLSRGFDERLERLRQALETSIDGRLAAQEDRMSERLDALSQRVVAVRDELAADIAETEDALARRFGGEVDRG